MNTLIILFASASSTFSLPPGLLSSVCYVESGHRADAFTADDKGSPSHGVCQIKMGTAQLMGFKGTAAQLQRPAINVKYAAKYLSHQLHRYGGDVTKALAAYNAGTCRINSQGLVMNRKYVQKVMLAWRSPE